MRGTEQRNNNETEKYNGIIMHLEGELTNLRSNISQQTQDYEALLNMKMKLEAEIDEYRKLMAGIFADEDRSVPRPLLLLKEKRP